PQDASRRTSSERPLLEARPSVRRPEARLRNVTAGRRQMCVLIPGWRGGSAQSIRRLAAGSCTAIDGGGIRGQPPSGRRDGGGLCGDGTGGQEDLRVHGWRATRGGCGQPRRTARRGRAPRRVRPVPGGRVRYVERQSWDG